MTRLRELSLDSKESPGFLKGRGLSLTTVRHLKSPITSTLQCCIRFRGVRSAGFALPFQIFRLHGRHGTE